MARVYLETSFFSACVSQRENPRSIAWRESSQDWWRREASFHELFVSDEVVAELSDDEFLQGPAALAMLRGINLLESDARVRGLAEILVREKVMPGPSVAGDAIHVAAAMVHRMDYILTWNVKHMANPNKRKHLAIVSMRLGFLPPEIVTPDLLVESDDE
ncbi:hypothetical protein RAS2_31440 [Phycisphaerae bacterium RAS2]|nr:hypothetical protein RAS2_31440 [Phycisphaerae bacterium RAS2]